MLERTIYRRFGKRALDVGAALAGLVIAAPLLAGIAVVSRFVLGPPVLYRQRRPGLHGAPFTIYKFRTMLDLRDAEGNPLPDEQRMTRFGRWLRASSLDELPELVNVLRGEMSLVGPRPLLMQYLDRYTPGQARRHEVLPGITGWAQVHGRNVVSWNRRFELDVWYVDHFNLRVDLAILWRTVRTVIVREGITARGHVSMHEYMGPEGERRAERPRGAGAPEELD